MLSGSRNEAKRKYAELCGGTNIFAEQVAGSRNAESCKLLKQRNKCDGIQKLFLSLFLFCLGSFVCCLHLLYQEKQSFPCKHLSECYKKLASRLWLVLFTLSYFFSYTYTLLFWSHAWKCNIHVNESFRMVKENSSTSQFDVFVLSFSSFQFPRQ